MHITYDNDTVQLPDFLLAGTARSGTSSLYFYLREHPEIYMPEFKEPHFFNYIGYPSLYPDRPPWTVSDYAKLFEQAGPTQFIGEASASYLYYFETSIHNIKAIYGDLHRNLKIIVILRNPIDRAWSHYILRRRKGQQMTFYEMIKDYNRGGDKIFHDFIRSGLYCDQLDAYRQAFPHFKIILFEELQHQPLQTLRMLYEYLNIKHTDYVPQNLQTVYNASGIPKNRLLVPIFNILFQDNRFKNLLKPMLPYRFRQNIKTAIGNVILDKRKPPKDVQSHLAQIFEPTITGLLRNISDPHQQAIIKEWLK